MRIGLQGAKRGEKEIKESSSNDSSKMSGFVNQSGLIKESRSQLEFALHYAAMGLNVLPLHGIETYAKKIRCSCRSGEKCDSAGKHPRFKGAYKSASANTAVIKDWWARFPESNIGIATGKRSGIFVLDIDVLSGGTYSLDDLEDYYKNLNFERFESVTETLTANTGSGGKHFYFAYPDSFEIRNSTGLIARGIDVRGDNGHVVAPPSNYISGSVYSWFGVDTPICKAPDWLLYELIRASRTGDRAALGFNEEKSTDRILEGKRHDTLVKQIMGLCSSFSESEVLSRALIFNAERLSPPMQDDYVRYQVKYLFGRYA